MSAGAGVGTVSTLSAAGAYNTTEAADEDLPDTPDSQSNITISIETVIMSALIFIGILAWFEFLRTWFDNVFTINGQHNYSFIYNRLWYAIFITALVLVLLYVVFRAASPVPPCVTMSLLPED